MPWQDTVFLIGNLVSAIVLLPTALDTSSVVPRRTSIPTTVILFSFSYTFFSLELLLSSGSSFLAATVWLFISVFRGPASTGSLSETYQKLSLNNLFR